MNKTRIGLRLLELESGLAANVDESSPELVDYEASRIVGQAARVAMLIRGQDVIEDERKFKKVLAAELHVVGTYDAVKRTLQEAGLLDERITTTGKRVLTETVVRVDHGRNYELLGDLWMANRERTGKEEALVHTLDAVVSMPRPLAKLDALNALSKTERQAVIEVASNAAILDRLGDTDADPFFSPLLWDVNPARLKKLLAACSHSDLMRALDAVRGQGAVDTSQNSDAVMTQAISAGILPTYNVNSVGGERAYSFAPYIGNLLSSDSEKTVLDKARALVACVKYGSQVAIASRIKFPTAILDALMDANRQYRLKPHTELKRQYGMLLKKQLGRVVETSPGWYSFELIPTEDNLRACRIACEIISGGEVMSGKDSAAESALALVSGDIEHPLKGVKVARRKRPARADELEGLVEMLRGV